MSHVEMIQAFKTLQAADTYADKLEAAGERVFKRQIKGRKPYEVMNKAAADRLRKEAGL